VNGASTDMAAAAEIKLRSKADKNLFSMFIRVNHSHDSGASDKLWSGLRAKRLFVEVVLH
jgi:hypothetical protein